MGSEFDRAIALTPRAATAHVGGDVREYDAVLDGGWHVGGGLNGGYVLAVIGNGISLSLADAGQPDPLVMSGYFLGVSTPGPAVVRTRLVRAGGRISTVAASLTQLEGGVEVERVTVLASYGDLDRNPDEVLASMAPPDLPPLEDCLPINAAPADFKKVSPLLERFGSRLDPPSAMWAVGKPSGQGLIQGWFEFADARPLDPVSLLVVVDSLPPVTFDLGMPGWAPTLELTVHIRARPAPGWAKVRHYSRNIAGGFFEEDCEVWDSTGRLVAQSRQLALQAR